MKSYANFIGIDIGKLTFTVAVFGKKLIRSYDNDAQGINKFIRDFKTKLPDALCVLEPTGGYELQLLLALTTLEFKVHRAHTVRVKNFIRSLKNAVKTDALDAKALAHYGYERHQQLELFNQPSAKALELFALVQRRLDLKQMLVAEKNRSQAPNMQGLQDSFERMLALLKQQIEEVNKNITQLIKQDAALQKKKEILTGIPGIAEIIGNELLVLLPELGELNRGEIASLVGVAPRANESGKYRGYRRTGYGRKVVKAILFMAAMAASRTKTPLGDYYRGLLARGKKKMVALVALMRKIIVIANARIKEFNKQTTVAEGCKNFA